MKQEILRNGEAAQCTEKNLVRFMEKSALRTTVGAAPVGSAETQMRKERRPVGGAGQKKSPKPFIFMKLNRHAAHDIQEEIVGEKLPLGETVH